MSLPGTCVVTGVSGFVGRGLRRRLEEAGWRVAAWTRRVEPGAVRFELGQEVDPASFRGAHALVHCAYDFGPVGWRAIHETNVAGSRKLFRAAHKAGLKRLVFISSLSAFPECRSLYGQAKLSIEKEAQAAGALVVRPGLIYSNGLEGMFGQLVRQVKTSRVVPVLVGGNQLQYLIDEKDLGSLILGCLDGRVPAGTAPVAAAHEQGLELREILRRISQALGRRTLFVPVPWQMAWLGLKGLELAGVPTKFRSDSLIGLIYQDRSPSWGLLRALGFQCQPFRMSPQMLGSSGEPAI